MSTTNLTPNNNTGTESIALKLERIVEKSARANLTRVGRELFFYPNISAAGSVWIVGGTPCLEKHILRFVYKEVVNLACVIKGSDRECILLTILICKSVVGFCEFFCVCAFLSC